MEMFDAHWMVADILARWPQTAPVFLRHRMFCVGCSLAGFDTLAEATKIYGVALDPFTEQLQAVIQSTEEQT